MQSPKKRPVKIFYFYAFMAAVVGLYYVNRHFFLSQLESGFRNLAFVGICTICVFGLIKRPKWFLYFFGVLMLQQLYSHGSQLFTQWHLLHTINYINLCIVVMMPVIFVSLIRNQHAAS